MITIKNSKAGFYGLIVAASLAMGAAQARAQDGIISKTPEAQGDYCHLKFPAIVSSTLGTDHPQLKDPQSGDIIDYYGSCDHDPLGRDEVEKQELDQLVRGLRNWAE
jgi:hypothetical protein